MSSKNDERKFSDIRKPKSSRHLKSKWLPKADFSDVHRLHSDRGLKIFAAVVAALVVIALLIGGYLLVLRWQATKSTDTLFGSLGNLVYNPFALSVQNASSSQPAASPPYGSSLLNVIPALKNIPAAFTNLQKFAELMIQAQASLVELRSDGLVSFLDGNGSQLLAELNSLDASLKDLNSTGDAVRNLMAGFGALNAGTANNYFSTGTDLQRETDALDAIVALLNQPESHVLVLFDDTSLERPGGGSISAYADLATASGSLSSLNAYDINALQPYDQKVVPPLQLQAIEASWKLRDSNWFFDFPTSASEVLSRIENAQQSENIKVTYGGVIAVSPQVIQGLVDVLGPVQLPDGREVTAVNLSKMTTQLGYIPFLNQFLPAVVKRAAALSSDEKGNLLKVAGQWLSNRDVMFYFNDPRLEELVNEYDLGGQMYPISSGYDGDYLAVVRTDVSGVNNSSDALSLRSTIGSDGTVQDDLSITRKNNSNYTDQEYFQVIVPSGSSLTSLIGNTHDTVTPLINYKRSNYSVDSTVAATEATRQVDPNSLAESYNMAGHTVFGFWLALLPGATGSVSVAYYSPMITLSNGENYQFTVERQAGENANIIYSVQAPQGWEWQQANDSTYLYSSEGLPGRTTLNLTLTKNGS
ncbi:MAG: DUF4012 domain-containing protein [Patescibacteria group bacterium]|nr:DUF4012 domain-containing protein [Patescibacteria group bacterium]MCL5224231.1 DUF4012 domain-containing protein [Patescibacteria group bacterium]